MHLYILLASLSFHSSPHFHHSERHTPFLLHGSSIPITHRYIKTNTIPNWHASGTMRMLPEADGGVVDARLRVYGVNNLRVIDCSIIPFLPDANIQASVFMIGEKGAQMIKEDHGF
jgi:choline dehydrogenase-like flavoprotein